MGYLIGAASLPGTHQPSQILTFVEARPVLAGRWLAHVRRYGISSSATVGGRMAAPMAVLTDPLTP